LFSVSLDVRGQGESPVRRHFLASIPSQRPVQLVGQFASVLDVRVDDSLGVLAVELYQHDVPRLALDQGGNLAVVAAEEQVALPMARNGSILDRCGALAD
jgi:hypothetical protein